MKELSKKIPFKTKDNYTGFYQLFDDKEKLIIRLSVYDKSSPDKSPKSVEIELCSMDEFDAQPFAVIEEKLLNAIEALQVN